MPFALIIAGLVLVISASRGSQSDLFNLVKNDFTGPSNFIFWTVSLLLIGSIGYIPKLKPLSTGFIVLVIIVLVLTKGNPKGQGGGFFQQFSSAIQSTQTAAPSAPSTSTASPVAGSGLSLPSLPNLQNFMIVN